MKKFNLYLIVVLALISCTKQEFQTNKANQSSTISAVTQTDTKLCSQMTLVKPQVDILILWDNTSSFNFVTPETKASMGNLINSVSEKFDYHILNAPLVPASSSSNFEMTLVAADSSSVSGNAVPLLRDKTTAVNSLGFSTGVGGAERGVDRAYDVITANRSNGIFRNGAYTIIVVLSNEDDKGCEAQYGYNKCTNADRTNYLAPKKQKMLCLRGNTSLYNCSGYTTLNSSMMRFITISPVNLNNNSCAANQNIPIAANYRDMAKFIYESPYNNGWPTSNDHLNPEVSGFYDSYNLCSINFNSIFDGVNTAIKQTLIKHVYSYWPVASSSASVDPDTLTVVRDDGKVLTNRTGESSPSDGFSYIGNQTNHATRSFPTSGEFFTGKMIQLHGVNDNDLIVYPRCLTVSFKEVKSNYGYIYLTNGEPYTPSIEVTINGATVPQSTTNGWSYMGLQMIASLDPNFKVANLVNGATSGYIIQLNGTYKVSNSGSVTIRVDYTSKSN